MKRYIQYKQYLQNYPNYPRKLANHLFSQRGISYVEIIATMLMSSIVLNFAFQGFADYRQTYLKDQVSINVNQRLRNVFGMIEPDIKQTGEGLISDPKFPAIMVSQVPIPNTNPVETTNEITIRRGLIDSSLPICQKITAGTSDPVMVMDASPGAHQGCELFDNDNDGWSDVAKQWRDKRLSNGGQVRAYLYDGQGNGEFFDYTGEITKDNSNANMTPTAGSPAITPYTVSLNNGSHTWQNSYTPNASSRIYLIEERRYRVEVDPNDPDVNILQLVIDDNETLNLVSDINKLNITTNLKQELLASSQVYECDVIPPNQSSDCSPNLTNIDSYSWAQIQSIDITVTALPGDSLSQSALRYLQASDLELTQKFFPRNIFSF